LAIISLTNGGFSLSSRSCGLEVGVPGSLFDDLGVDFATPTGTAAFFPSY